MYGALQALGGNGFVEDFPMARLFRHSPLNSVWEGSGNVIALDIVMRGSKSLPALLNDIKKCRGSDSYLDQYIARLEADIATCTRDPISSINQRAARNIVDRLAIALQSSALLRYGNAKVAGAYIESRIHPLIGSDVSERGVNIGGGVIFQDALAQEIIQRNMPHFN